MTLLDILGFLFGSKQDKDVKKLRPILDRVNSFKDAIHQLSDDELKNKTAEFKERLKNGDTLDDFLPEAFAVVREATHRVLGERKTVKDPVHR